VLAFAGTVGLTLLLWVVVWHLYLRRVPVFATIGSVLFQILKDDSVRSPPQPRTVTIR